MSSVSAVNSLVSSTAATNSAINISSILAATVGASSAGIDVTSAVAAAIYADRAPERLWQADQTTLSSQTTALNAMQTATTAIATDLQSLNSLTGPLASRIVSSSSGNVTATAAAGTSAGVHTVVVNNLASTDSWYSDLEASPTAALPTSSLTITPASGGPVTIATGTGNTGDNLNDLASTINADNIGIKATVVSDATGSRLALVSTASGSAAGFSITSANYSGNSWTSPSLPTGSSLGANSVTLTSSAGSATITTTSGETYAQLATAINAATISGPSTSSSSTQSGLTSSTPLTAGSVTTINDAATGQTFTYTAAAGDTVADLNTAIAGAVSAGTLSNNVAGAVVGGKEVISEGTEDQGITVSSNDAALGTMNAAAGTSTPLGLTATAGSDANGTNLTISGPSGSSFTINEPAFGFTQAAAGANASITVDGVPVSSASDTVTGAISGVTLNLLGADPGSQVSLTVASDAGQVSTAINQLVTDYNTAVGLVNTQYTVNGSTDSSGNTTSSEGVLSSDPVVANLQSALEQAINYVATPATGTTTTVSSLSDLGITMNTDGTLSVDSSTLDAALTNSPTDVQNFFEGTSLNGFANSMNNSLTSLTEPGNGAFTVDLRSISATNSALTSQINDFESEYITNQQTVLTAEFSKAEIALQQLPTQMAQINAELGLTPTNGNSNG